MEILVAGDGPLAEALAARAQAHGHTVLLYRLDEATAPLDEALEGVEPALAIEAMLADTALKWETITTLESLVAPDAPLLAAALTASATEVASWCVDPARVSGYAALPPLGSAVELMEPLQGAPEAAARAADFWRSLEMEPVPVGDLVGGVVPRVVVNLINEAAHALQERAASAAEIDRAMQLGTRWPRGPLAWADLIGPAQVVAILDALARDLGADSYHAAPLLRQRARAGVAMAPA